MLKTWPYIFFYGMVVGKGAIIRREIGVKRPWRLHLRGGVSGCDALHPSPGVQTWGGLCQHHCWSWWPQEDPGSPWSCCQPPGTGTRCWCHCAPGMRWCWWASSLPRGCLLGATPCLTPDVPALTHPSCEVLSPSSRPAAGKFAWALVMHSSYNIVTRLW